MYKPISGQDIIIFIAHLLQILFTYKSYFYRAMRKNLRLIVLSLLLLLVSRVASAQYQYPFQNPALPTEDRITNLLSLMTLDEKVNCLSTNASVAPLGVKGTGHVAGL